MPLCCRVGDMHFNSTRLFACESLIPLDLEEYAPFFFIFFLYWLKKAQMHFVPDDQILALNQ